MPRTHRELPYPLMPTLRAANAEVVIHPDDRAQGTVVVGGQGSGKTSYLLRSFLNDCRDPNCAPILIDPKSEVARLALALIPPDCGKEVWFLNLAYPRFGMSPLWLPPETMRDPRKFANAVTGIADNVVLSLLDVNEGQIFQASRDLLYHATIGALAIAAAEDKRPSLEDIYGLLLPYREDLRRAVSAAVERIPDLDQTKEFWSREIPDMLNGAPSLARQRLAPPRNKVAGIVAIPPLRRFFHHPVEIPLARIIEDRSILIVDAAMGGPRERPGIGEDNAVACIHFLGRMLHTNLQHLIHVPAPLRPRVSTYWEEADAFINETAIDMMSTHRAAGFETTLVLQFFAQLLSDTPGRSEKIRKGVMNLCQSRLLFRLGDPRDAEEAARVTMAVYDSLIRSDVDARRRMRGTPETLLQLRNHYCSASVIAMGQRVPSFIGRTYAMPRGTGYSAIHYQRMLDRCGVPYPEHLGSTYKRKVRGVAAIGTDAEPDDVTTVEESRAAHATDAGEAAREDVPVAAPAHVVDEQQAASAPASARPAPPSRRSRLQPELWELVEPDRAVEVMRSRALEIAGRPLGDGEAPRGHDGPTPATLSELAVFDQITDVDVPAAPKRTTPLKRHTRQQMSVILLLDRVDFMTTAQLARAAWPAGASERTVQQTLARMEAAGLILRTQSRLKDRSQRTSPPLWSLAPEGFKLGRNPPTNLGEPIPERRRYRASRATSGDRAIHDLHVINWLQALTTLLPRWVTGYWRTPRYSTGRFKPPLLGEGRTRRPLHSGDVWLGEGYSFFGIPTDGYEEVLPDLIAEIHVVSDPGARPGRRYDVRFDLALELDLTKKLTYNREKLARYDAFLTGWGLAHRRIERLGTRPIVIFTTPDAHHTLALAKLADEVLVGSIGRNGAPDHERYYPSRDHVLFAAESDVHEGSLRALKLPPLPLKVREALGEDRLAIEQVAILPPSLVRAAKAQPQNAGR